MGGLRWYCTAGELQNEAEKLYKRPAWPSHDSILVPTFVAIFFPKLITRPDHKANPTQWPGFVASIAVAALALSSAVAQGVNLKQKPLIQYIEYTSVDGYFLQDSNSTNPSTFDFVRDSISI